MWGWGGRSEAGGEGRAGGSLSPEADGCVWDTLCDVLHRFLAATDW